jgi:hypothetical protein
MLRSHMKKLTFALMFGGLVVSAAALDVAGKWSGMLSSMGSHGPNETTIYAVLQQTGGRITGTVGPDKVHQLPIRNCRIEGSEIIGDVEWEVMHFRFTLSAAGTGIHGGVDIVTPDGQVAKARLEIARAE